MQIDICSLFRDSQRWHGRVINQVDRYFEQFARLSKEHNLQFHLLEGNSADDTYAKLEEYKNKYNINLYKQEVKGSEVESTASELRLANLSSIANIVLNSALEKAQIVLWIESDLIHDEQLIPQLLKFIETDKWQNSLGIAPIPIIGDVLYDNWAFKDSQGRYYPSSAPSSYFDPRRGYIELQGFGCCALLNPENMRKHGIYFGKNCFRSLCDQGVKAGLKLWCDPRLFIRHPDSELVVSRWI